MVAAVVVPAPRLFDSLRAAGARHQPMEPDAFRQSDVSIGQDAVSASMKCPPRMDRFTYQDIDTGRASRVPTAARMRG
jgi:hypothetical protein